MVAYVNVSIRRNVLADLQDSIKENTIEAGHMLHTIILSGEKK